jgi:serine/threonine protein kinase
LLKCLCSGKWRGQVDVAIKQLVSGDNDEEFYKETENMQNMHHPHLVQVFGVCSKEEPLMMVMEFLEKGDLRKHLHTFGKEMKCDALINICENVSSYT